MEFVLADEIPHRTVAAGIEIVSKPPDATSESFSWYWPKSLLGRRVVLEALSTLRSGFPGFIALRIDRLLPALGRGQASPLPPASLNT